VANGVVERDWRAVDPEPISSPKHVPAWSHVWPWIDISTMNSWASVADWATRHFAGDQRLPDGYVRKLDAIAAASADPGKRAIAALRLVQDSIRYTSLSIGEGGFIPRAPAEVVRSGFGDCKDKSQLLAVTLRHLGIPAWPALTDMDEGPGLANVLPSAGAFDHAIVLARIGERDRWFDATQSYQGGTMATLAALPYGYALPLRPGQAGLVAIPNPVPRTHTMTSVDTYAYVDGGLSLKTETTFSADEADIKRSDLGTSGVAKIERNYLDYYRGMYPGVMATGHIVVSDDRDSNRLVIRESYRIPDTAKNYAKTIANLPVAADTMRDLYGDIDDADGRSAPIALPWTIKRAHRIVFDMPGRAINLPALEDSHGPAFDLTTRAWHDGDQAIMDFTLTGKAMVLPASAAVDYAAQAKALDDATNWNIDTTIPGLALIDASWLGLGLAILLVAGLAGLTLWRLRNRRTQPPAKAGMETRPVIRHVPLTRRDAA
jgi:transglutaminase-like putative cysteine protease